MSNKKKKDLAALLLIGPAELAAINGGGVNGSYMTMLVGAGTGGSNGRPGDVTDPKHEHTDDESA